PGMDESSTRRRALPSVWPKPRSNGSITTRAWRGATGCTFTTRGFRNSATEPCMHAHLAGRIPAAGRTKRSAQRNRALRSIEKTVTSNTTRRSAESFRTQVVMPSSLRIQLDDEVLVDVRQDFIPGRHLLE